MRAITSVWASLRLTFFILKHSVDRCADVLNVGMDVSLGRGDLCMAHDVFDDGQGRPGREQRGRGGVAAGVRLQWTHAERLQRLAPHIVEVIFVHFQQLSALAAG